LYRLQTVAIASQHALPARPLTLLAAIACLFALASSIAGFVLKPDWLIDIGANTFAATDALAHGLNPYITRSQLWVNDFPANTPHLTIENGQISMFGVPYFHGYPYFPLMLMSYLPAYAISDSYAAVRITHLLLMVLNVVAFRLLIDKLIIDKAQRKAALLIAVAAYFGVLRYAVEAMVLGVTDLLISTYLLFCFAALGRQKFFIAGLLLGCAQACKLLPAPFVFIGIAWLLYRQRGLWTFTAAYALASAVLILPFVAWHPQGFLSATILYYLTHHQGGDFTSLWFFLPSFMQGIFLLAGLLFTLASIVLLNQPGQKNLTGCMAGAYASYAIFMAFSKMTHLNYLWGVFPLGCIVLAIQLASPHRQSAK
jgi:hypothetical protein